MRKVLILLCVTLAVFSACSNDTAKKLPKDIIGEDKMKAIVKEVLLAESAVNDDHLPIDSSKKLMLLRYEQIASKYNTTGLNLIKSMQYYNAHPQQYGEILQSVIDSLSAMEARTK